MAIKFKSLTTDNICLVAILSLDIRPSSVCVYEVEGVTNSYDVQVHRSETIGRNFEHYAKRFGEVMQKAFGHTDLGQVKIELKVVDELKYRFEEQKACQIAMNPLVVGQ